MQSWATRFGDEYEKTQRSLKKVLDSTGSRKQKRHDKKAWTRELFSEEAGQDDDDDAEVKEVEEAEEGKTEETWSPWSRQSWGWTSSSWEDEEQI